MLKRFVDGLIFGLGFAVSLVVVFWVAGGFFMRPHVTDVRTLSSPEMPSFKSGGARRIDSVPKIKSPERFLGSTGIFSGDFSSISSTVLAAGDGKIVGTVISSGVPVEGLRLRLALNNSAMSQWAVSDAKGKYAVSVPFGKYVVDGFELDRVSANTVLKNKIHQPECGHSTGAFNVANGVDGHGLDFRFVDPVVRNMKKNSYSATEDILLEWEPYPGASSYIVQVYKKDGPSKWSNNTLFEWPDVPSVIEPRLDPKKLGVKFEAGKYYSMQITALDKDGNTISETPSLFRRYDFAVVE